jgi:hypothetical protein
MLNAEFFLILDTAAKQLSACTVTITTSTQLSVCIRGGLFYIHLHRLA